MTAQKGKDLLLKVDSDGAGTGAVATVVDQRSVTVSGLIPAVLKFESWGIPKSVEV